MVVEPCCCNESVMEPPMEASTSTAPVTQNHYTRIKAVECSVHYIVCLKAEVKALQDQLQACRAQKGDQDGM